MNFLQSLAQHFAGKPIDWDELEDPSLRPDKWTIRDAPARLAERGDLFASVLTDRQKLPPIG